MNKYYRIILGTIMFVWGIVLQITFGLDIQSDIWMVGGIIVSNIPPKEVSK